MWGPQHLIQYSHIIGGCTTWKTQGPSYRKSSICIFRAYANRNGLTRPSAAPASEWANCGSSQRRRCVPAGFRPTTSASAAPPFCRRPCGRSSKATWRCKKRTAEPVFVTKTGRPLDRSHLAGDEKAVPIRRGSAGGGFPTTCATCLLGLLFLGKGPVPAGGYFRPFQRQRHTHLHRGKRHGPRPAATGAHRAHHNTRSIMLLGNRSPTSLWGKIPSNQQPPSPRNRKTGTKNQVGGRSFFPGFIFMGIFGPAPINPGTFQIQIQGLIYGSYKTLGTFLSFHSVVWVQNSQYICTL